MKTIIPSNANDDIFDALLEICSIHMGLISQNFSFAQPSLPRLEYL